MTEPRAQLLRGFLVACQAATILVGWPLWQPHDDPPSLGAVDLAVPFGPLLLLSLALVLARPLAGGLAHAAVLAVSILFDETRAQPAPISTALLLVAAAPERAWLGRAHLGAQWAWAGIAKILSPAFAGAMAPALARALPAALPHRELVVEAAAWVEVALGLSVLVPSIRRTTAAVGCVLHLAALAVLVRLGVNPGAWAWSLALAAASIALFSGPAPATSSNLRRATCVALAASPALFYLGLLHPSAAHQLYAATAPTTLTCDAAGRCRPDVETRETLEAFGAPIPGRSDLLRAYFLARCAPGDRWLARSRMPGASYGEIVAEAHCVVETSDPAVTTTLSRLNARALSSYPGAIAAPAGVEWERP